jgi:hypothetical protein
MIAKLLPWILLRTKGPEKIDVGTQVGVSDFQWQCSGSGLIGRDDIYIVDD